MVDRSGYRAGTSSITVSANLSQDQLRQSIENHLRTELAKTGEWLAQFDYGPPQRAATEGLHNFDVMFRTGPAVDGDAGPAVERKPPQVEA